MAESQAVARCIKAVIAITISLTLWLLPTEAFGISNLTIIEQRLISIFIFATLMWVFEVVPAWTTSVLIVVLLLLTVSDSSLWLFVQGIPTEELGQTVKYKSIMHCFADPIIMLFIGGFILAIAATKSNLDVLLARVMLKPFGTQSRYVLLGFILVTAVFSMFLSNTATAAMMLTFLTPVLKVLPADGKGKQGLAMAIPVAANIGGMGTPIGTPPNAIALKYLNDPEGLNLNIGFWGVDGIYAAPYNDCAVHCLVHPTETIPFQTEKALEQIEGEAKRDWRSIVVYITFAITVLLWMFDKFTGVNSNVVAMIPVAVFCITGVITKRSGRNQAECSMDGCRWIRIGSSFTGNRTSQTYDRIHSVQYMATRIDDYRLRTDLLYNGKLHFTYGYCRTASILAIAGSSMRENLSALGGVETLLIGVAIGSSLAMILPISTPPNALAHATGMIQQKDMEKVGIIMGIVGLILGYTMLIILGSHKML